MILLSPGRSSPSRTTVPVCVCARARMRTCACEWKRGSESEGGRRSEETGAPKQSNKNVIYAAQICVHTPPRCLRGVGTATRSGALSESAATGTERP